MNAFDEHLEELLQTVLEARANFDIWWIYANNETCSQYGDVFDTYSEFFRISRQAHFVTSVIALYRLYDKRSDVLSIPALLEEGKNDQRFSLSVLDEANRRFRKALPIWENLSHLRHKLFAHRDKNVDHYSIFGAVSLTPEDIRSLTDDSLDLLNGLLYYRQRTTYTFWEYTTGDTLDVLKTLHAARQNTG